VVKLDSLEVVKEAENCLAVPHLQKHHHPRFFIFFVSENGFLQQIDRAATDNYYHRVPWLSNYKEPHKCAELQQME